MADSTTIDIYNKTGNKDLYLFFDYAEGGTEGVTNFSNMTYLQPWSGPKALDLDKPFSCSFDYLNSGTFWYIITNDEGAATISKYPNTAMGSEDPNWVGGFFELSLLASNPEIYMDVTNVDQVGLFCGIGFADGSTCGYGKTANDMISGIITACGLGEDTKAKKTLTGSDNKTYAKLWGPTLPAVSALYANVYDGYISAITANDTNLTINSDSTEGSNHAGTQLPSLKFTGKFGAPETMPAGSPVSKEDVVLHMTSETCKAIGEPVQIYFTKEGINGGTIMSGSSAGGMYVYPAFEYPDPKDQSKILKGGWASDVSLNWTATGTNAVQNTTCFQAMVSSVGRDIVTAMNMGYIGVTAAKENFVYGNSATYATEANQEKYINKWNRYITSHSDSYGMAYSDAAHQKVQFHPAVGSTITCYIFGQDDPETTSYWSEND
ncbi:hypothetical protein AB9P05_21870 [Roseivirga sp. BDSF3-8]|uniref:hypothetical protein n=1 Tax=Roseivirga sp. BDSF3-8 TaxID=3241598 RepID=UPI0035324928